VQLFIVHVVSSSLNYVTWQDGKKAAVDLRPIYRATNAEQAKSPFGLISMDASRAALVLLPTETKSATKAARQAD
jgi:hypothetical protein